MFGFNVAEGPSLYENEVFLDTNVCRIKFLIFAAIVKRRDGSDLADRSSLSANMTAHLRKRVGYFQMRRSQGHCRPLQLVLTSAVFEHVEAGYTFFFYKKV